MMEGRDLICGPVGAPQTTLVFLTEMAYFVSDLGELVEPEDEHRDSRGTVRDQKH